MNNSDHEYVKSLIEDKCDRQLGLEVHKLLVDLGFENPTNEELQDPKMATAYLREGIGQAMRALGMDMNDPSLQDTPKRFACMFVGELTRGLDYSFFPKCTATPSNGMDQMVIPRRVHVISLCEHHLQTIDGFCQIAYIPKDKLLGLSKFARVVDFFSRRPQVQERLTEQVFHTLAYILDTENVAVSITATHYCMKARGAMQHASDTTTNKFGGVFLTKPAAREEFFAALHLR